MYNFVLLSRSSGKRKSLQHAPVNWEDSKLSLLRDKVYYGVFKSISAEFEFVYDGYDFIKKEFSIYGPNLDLILRVYRNGEHFFDGSLDFSDYEIDINEGKFKVDLLQSSFIQKFQNRDDLALNVMNDLSIDNIPIEPARVEVVKLQNSTIKFDSLFGLSEAEPDNTDNVIPGAHMRTLPTQLDENDNPQVFQPGYISPSFEITDKTLVYDPTNAHYVNDKTTAQEVSFVLDYSIDVFIGGGIINGGGWVYIEKIDSNDNLVETILEKNYTQQGGYSFNFPFTTTLQPNEYLLFFCVPRLSQLLFSELMLTVDEDSIYEDTYTTAFLPFELIQNMIAQMTGKSNLVSNIFGRTDLGYAEDGEGAYDFRTKGALVRGFSLSGYGTPDEDERTTDVSMKFKDLFQSYSATYSLGLKIVRDVVYIDPISDLFNKASILDIGEVSRVKYMPAKDYMFNSVKAGFKEMSFEEVNGVDEFNGEVSYTNDLIPVKKELDIQSPYFGTGNGIEFARRKPITQFGTEDTRYDKEIYHLRCVKVGSTYQDERLENLSFVEGVLSPSTVRNAYIAPSQNMYRWRKYLNIPVYKSENTYVYQSKEYNSTLRVQGVVLTEEGQNLTFTDRPFFVPEMATFDKPLTRDILINLLADPLQIIKFKNKGEAHYHFLQEIDSETEKDGGNWSTLAIRPFGYSESPIDLDRLSIVKYGDGATDYVKYGDGDTDYVLFE